MTRLWLVAVVCNRSSASITMATAESNPKVMAVGRDARVTSALVGASSVSQLEQNVAAVENLDFDDAELAEIDRYAVDGSLNIWASSSEA